MALPEFMQRADRNAAHDKLSKRLNVDNDSSEWCEGHSDSHQVRRPVIDLDQAESRCPVGVLNSRNPWKSK
jgi:hypothetical protein